MCKLLFFLLFDLYMAGCTSSSALQPSSDPDAQQFRNQHMELYRTMEMMARPQPIIFLKPNKRPVQ
ncbi:hypothetical protein L4D76_23895 [Photobacterium sagamiensis]|uniref:hypothetical protein n=1 Tax=Photobacterium sagamiensis TaxID=2910241 RepID=UPI003D0F658C